MPDTTPRPKETAKTFTQNLYKFLYWGLPVRSHSNSSRASQLARPIVKAGKMMWNEIVNANWMRDRKSASNSIDGLPSRVNLGRVARDESIGRAWTLPGFSPRRRRILRPRPTVNPVRAVRSAPRAATKPPVRPHRDYKRCERPRGGRVRARARDPGCGDADRGQRPSYVDRRARLAGTGGFRDPSRGGRSRRRLH